MNIEQKRAEKKLFAGEKKPSMKRRKEHHDYHGERFYMITLVVAGRRPVFGHLDIHAPQRIETNGQTYTTTVAETAQVDAQVVLSPLGEAISKEWKGISRYYPQVAVIALQMMPDHLHGILYVREATTFHLGQVVKGFKLGCNRILREMQGGIAAIQSQPTSEGNKKASLPASSPSLVRCDSIAAPSLPASPPSLVRCDSIAAPFPLWEPGYNDRILHNYSTLEKWKAYLRDNPKRLAIRRLHPEYFRVRFGITIGQQTYAAIGNRFLLSYPEKKQIQLSRSLTDEAIAKEVSDNLTLARNGTILVSPAISKGEGTVMRAALEAKLPLIFLTPWGFNTFSKPGHQYYEACASGRFLILAPWPHQNERIPLTRQMCLDLNRMTKEICETDKYE